MEPEIIRSLNELYSASLDLYNERLKQGKVKFSYSEKEVPVFEKFDYDTGSCGINFTSSKTTTSKTLLHTSAGDFSNEVMSNFQGYPELVSQVAERTKNKSQSAASLLHVFTDRLLQEFGKGNVNNTNKTDIILTFLNDIDDGKTNWHIETRLNGLCLLSDMINISGNMVLRRPTDADVVDFLDMLRVGVPIQVPSAVLIIDVLGDIVPFPLSIINRTILFLQLFRAGSISIIDTSAEVKSIFRYPPGVRLGSSPLPLAINSHSRIGQDDRKLVEECWTKLEKVIPVDDSGNIDTSGYIGIALGRYVEAISRPEGIENRIGNSVLGLEALLLKRKESGGASNRLGQRMAKVLSFFGERGIVVHGKVMEAYRIRNDFVRGSPRQKSDPPNNELLDLSVEFLRKLILINMAVSSIGGKKKDDFISLIDQSLINREANDELALLLQIEYPLAALIELAPKKLIANKK